MSKSATPVSLEERIASVKEDWGDAVRVDDISHVVGSLMSGKAQEDVSDIVTELRELLDYIGAARSELVGINAKSLSSRDIPKAGDHLAEIVRATEDAASTIMNAADTISQVAEHIPEDQAEKLQDVSVSLFEASSFQDLTGQRITRVTKTLNHLESRLSALAEAIGDEYVEPDEDDIERDEQGIAVHQEDLLHGPQLEGEGNSQDEIDAILASFD